MSHAWATRAQEPESWFAVIYKGLHQITLILKLSIKKKIIKRRKYLHKQLYKSVISFISCFIIIARIADSDCSETPAIGVEIRECFSCRPCPGRGPGGLRVTLGTFVGVLATALRFG